MKTNSEHSLNILRCIVAGAGILGIAVAIIIQQVM